MVKISDIIPKTTDASFQKNLKSIGIAKYSIISARSVVLYGSTKSRSDRAAALKEFATLYEKIGAKYGKTASSSGAGFVQIGNAKFEMKVESSAGSHILKPGFFGTPMSKIVDTDIPYKSYTNGVITAIEETQKLTTVQKDFLKLLVEQTAGPTSTRKAAIGKILLNNMSGLALNTINNDFGEVLGPIAIMTKGLLPISGKSAVVFIPGRSNEPLLDYKIRDDKQEYKISAKSGETTNTLKPGDVVNLIKPDKRLLKKWKDTPQYKVLEILNEGSTKQGPITAGLWLKKNGYEKYFDWLKKDDYTEEIRQKSEDTIVKISKEALDFTPIYADATNQKVFYVKFKLSQSGDMEWKLVETPKDKKNKETVSKRVSFRSKNYVGRPGDKLGFQV